MDLGKLLRKNGVDAYLDKWDLIPGQDATYFMESQIRDSDFVVLVCTPLYAEKSNIPRGGVGYERTLFRQKCCNQVTYARSLSQY